MQYSIPSKWMNLLVLNDDFCAVEGCEEMEQRHGNVEEDCWESELMLGPEVALEEIDLTEPRLGGTEEDCVDIDPRLEEDCEVIEPRLGLQELVKDL